MRGLAVALYLNHTGLIDFYAELTGKSLLRAPRYFANDCNAAICRNEIPLTALLR